MKVTLTLNADGKPLHMPATVDVPAVSRYVTLRLPDEVAKALGVGYVNADISINAT